MPAVFKPFQNICNRPCRPFMWYGWKCRGISAVCLPMLRWRFYTLRKKDICYLCRSVALNAQAEYPAYNLCGFFVNQPMGRIGFVLLVTVVRGFPDMPLFWNTARTFFEVFLACISLNQSCTGRKSLNPSFVSILSIMAI